MNEKKKKLSGFKIRLIIILSLMLIVFTVIIARLFYIQVITGNEWKERGERQYKSEYVVKSRRGRIVTSDGETLAYDSERYYITLDPTLIEDENLPKLLEMFNKYIPGVNIEKLKKDIVEKKSQGKKYLKIENPIDYKTKKEMTDIFAAKGNFKLKSGVFFDINFERNYVKNNAFQETVGYLDSENNGIYGIEKFYDDKLKGVDGLIEGFRIPKSFLSLVTTKEIKETVTVRDGYNAILTIDSVLQYALDDEMRKAYEQYNAETTMGILVEVETGKILAMSSYPKGRNNAEVKNRPITDLFEPGSIFKPVTVAMGLELGTINKNSVFQSSGSIRIADKTISDHDGSTSGSVSLERLIANSGNVGMVRIAQTIKSKQFHNYLGSVGLGSKTGIDTYAEVNPKLVKVEDLTELRKSNIAFGQGIATTQIQMLMALNTVINSGKLMKPYIVDRFEDDDKNIVIKNEPVVVKKVFSPETSKITRELMEAVVVKGTGRKAQISGYRIGGKTGTAQKSGARGYEEGKYFSSFFAFFPIENPKYAILITVNEPKGTYYGGLVALPPAKAVLEKLIKYKGINPQGIIEKNKEKVAPPKVVEKKDINKIKEEFNKGVMPNLINLSLRDVLSTFPQQKYAKNKIVGSGKVVGQMPHPGTKITKDTEIKIVLE